MCTFVPTPIQDARIIGTHRPYEVLTMGIKALYPPSPYPPKGPYDRSSQGATLLLKRLVRSEVVVQPLLWQTGLLSKQQQLRLPICQINVGT